MPIITIGTNNLEEEMAAMKAMLERLVKENEEKEVVNLRVVGLQAY